jgi:hypothetical protein
MPEIIGEYQYSKRDLIGHGAFAVVFLGHSRSVNILIDFDYFYFVKLKNNRIQNNKWL